MRVRLENEYGNIKECKIGFSWTVFFFGFFVPFVRGDFKWGVIMLLADVITAIFTFGIGTVFINFCFCLFYNKTYINDLLSKGYKPCTETDESILKQKM